MVIEGTLALTGQYFITESCEQRGMLPGFIEGFKNISRDEHRHVAYGTWFLQQKAADPALRPPHPGQARRAAADRGRACSCRPARTREDWELLGFSSEEINEFAFTALTRRLKVIGVDLGAAVA